MIDSISDAVRPAQRAPAAPAETGLQPASGVALPDGAASLPSAPHENESPAPLSIDAKTAHWLPLALPMLAVTLLMTGLLVLSDI